MAEAVRTKAGLGLGRLRDWLIGVLVLGVLVVWVERSIGWGPLLSPWRTLDAHELAGLMALSALSYGLRALRVYDYFLPLTRGRFLVTLRLSLLHNLANNLLPMRSGEAAFPLLLRRYFGQRLLQGTFALLVIRLLDLHLMGLVVIAVLYVRSGEIFWVLLGALWLGVVPLAYTLRARVHAWARGTRGRWGYLLAEAITALPRSTRVLARLYLWTALSWLAKVMAFSAVLRHFLTLEPWQALAGILGAELSSILPVHGIAGTGSYEAAAVAVLVPLGVPMDQALAGAVNLHLFLLGVTVLLGLIGLLIPRD